MPINAVDLTDPAREPTDSELEALMRSVRDKAVDRHASAQQRFMAHLADGVANARNGGTGPDLSVDQAEEETVPGPGP
ncbi:MAG: hypothetical protein F4213_16635 [Boseongicola sp. SB0677_bin_26]|nr:hypothetical protein [Boseongicola sp. SB0665_bin_10]MYG27619.1 hypothetical protein [Boseongicola sp. SB0677_bin_26]